eukprot:NODE_2397_length_1211_cov_31.550775_g2186_i0.p1 GENE.NODE_2397_length_1211_cov_31.550775_g2186_i0~~NODE_2397_length_1211_cov_31.550775_g2186_i0.p1  ORF type:complete len:195 (+),score=28.87 NODE_2397_length_1211_cov_31.550775_g2186_i0:550-1134(+)
MQSHMGLPELLDQWHGRTVQYPTLPFKRDSEMVDLWIRFCVRKLVAYEHLQLCVKQGTRLHAQSIHRLFSPLPTAGLPKEDFELYRCIARQAVNYRPRGPWVHFLAKNYSAIDRRDSSVHPYVELSRVYRSLEWERKQEYEPETIGSKEVMSRDCYWPLTHRLQYLLAPFEREFYRRDLEPLFGDDEPLLASQH